MNQYTIEEKWDLEIKPSNSLWHLNLKELWKYRDLLFLFVRRDVVTVYKQTILGPVWFFLQPLFTTIVFAVIFGGIAKLSTDGLPKILFYLSGIITWNYFSESLITTSKTFVENSNIFGKVYFPRLILPLSKVISGLIKFFIQFGMLIGIYIFFVLVKKNPVQPTIFILLIPYLIFLIALLGLGFGLIISSLTIKYRDLTFLISFGVQLLMYAAPVIYPLSYLSEKKYKLLILANPMTSIIETFRFALFGQGYFELNHLLYSTLFILATIFVGIITFNKVEKSFIDTV